MTKLLLPRYTRGGAPDSRTLARLIAHDVGMPSSWQFNPNVNVDINRSALVVDLGDTDPARVQKPRAASSSTSTASHGK